MAFEWVRPTTLIPNASMVVGLPAIRGGPFANDIEPIVVSPFGPRAPIPGPLGMTLPFHYGVDFCSVPSPNVLAVFSGTVELVMHDDPSGAGNWVRLRHDAEWTADYYHLDPNIPVTQGQAILSGDVVGLMDTSGEATGPHLHFQFGQNGSAVDPLPIFDAAPDVGEVVTQIIETGADVQYTKEVNANAIALIYSLLKVTSAVAGQQDGQFIGTVTAGSDTPAGYKDVLVRVKEG